MPSTADFVQRFEEAWREPLTKFVELFAQDGVLFQSGMEKPIPRSEIVGHQARTLTLLPDMSVRVTRSAVDGDDVFIEWQAAGTFLDRPVSWGGASRFTLRDGLIVEEVAYFDTLPLRALVDPHLRGGDIATQAINAVESGRPAAAGS